MSTEELRTAMVHYRWLVEDLLEVKPTLSRPKRPTAPPVRPTPAVPPTAAVPPIPAAPPGVPAARIGDGHAAQPEKEVKRDEPVEVESTSDDTVDGKVDEPVADERQSPNSSRSVDA